MVASCCICGVEKGSAQDDNLVFHRFPKDENLRSQWWEITGKKYASAHVCSKHFRPEDYRNYEDTNLIRRILKSSAVPQKNNNSDTVEFVQNCFLFNSVDLSFAESKDKSLESVEHANIEPKTSNKMESDDTEVLTVGPSTSPQTIVIIGDLNNDLTDVTLNNISKEINNTNVKNTDKTIDSVESNDTVDEKKVENNNKIINSPTIKTSKPEGNKTMNSVEIADNKEEKNINKAIEYLANRNKNEIISNSTARDDFMDESDDEIFNILTDVKRKKNTDEAIEYLTNENKNEIINNNSMVKDDFVDESDDEIFNILTDDNDDNTFISTRSTKREIESYNKQKQKNKIETNKRKKLQQLKKLRYQSNTLGVTRKEDFTNESAWMRFQNFIDDTRTKYRKVLNENRKLKQRITFYQNLLKYMNKKIKTDKVD